MTFDTHFFFIDGNRVISFIIYEPPYIIYIYFFSDVFVQNDFFYVLRLPCKPQQYTLEE